MSKQAPVGGGTSGANDDAFGPSGCPILLAEDLSPDQAKLNEETWGPALQVWGPETRVVALQVWEEAL